MPTLGLIKVLPRLRSVMTLLTVALWICISGCGEQDSRTVLERAQPEALSPGVPPDLAEQIGPITEVATNESLVAKYWHAKWRNPQDGRIGKCIFGRSEGNDPIGPYCYDAASVRRLQAIQAVPSHSAFDVLGVLPREADLVRLETDAGEKFVQVNDGVFAIRSEVILNKFSVRLNGLFRNVDLSGF